MIILLQLFTTLLLITLINKSIVYSFMPYKRPFKSFQDDSLSTLDVEPKLWKRTKPRIYSPEERLQRKIDQNRAASKKFTNESIERASKELKGEKLQYFLKKAILFKEKRRIAQFKYRKPKRGKSEINKEKQRLYVDEVQDHEVVKFLDKVKASRQKKMEKSALVKKPKSPPKPIKFDWDLTEREAYNIRAANRVALSQIPATFKPTDKADPSSDRSDG